VWGLLTNNKRKNVVNVENEEITGKVVVKVVVATDTGSEEEDCIWILNTILWMKCVKSISIRQGRVLT
jgi:hypothetical protein